MNPPNVVLDLKLQSGKRDIVPLTYGETGQQRRGNLWQASLIAESSGHFLIFTDRFASNANIQGQCGASPDGERFLHIVSLAPIAKETLSFNLDSCWRSITAIQSYPRFDPDTRTPHGRRARRGHFVFGAHHLHPGKRRHRPVVGSVVGEAQQPHVILRPHRL